MELDKPIIYGIIHIGSATLSMRIVGYRGINQVQVIEEVKRETSFGEEVFLNKKLSFKSIRRLCILLNGLKQLLADYHVTAYEVYATAILREAENRRSIIDLIHVHTGFQVHVIDMPQEIYFKHFALHYELEQINRQNHQYLGSDFLFVDITSGCVGLTVWEKGALRYQHNVHIGTLRLLETFRLNQRESQNFPEAMTEYIHAIMRPLWETISRFHPKYLVLSGREARIMASLMHLDMKSNMAMVRPEAFYELYEKVSRMSSPRIMNAYGLQEQQADSVLPTSHLYWEILQNVHVESILMMGTTFLESAAMYYGARKTRDPALLQMRVQNLELTRSIASNYYYEPEHAQAMEMYSQIIMEAFRTIHGLNDRDVFLLRMAIILYQIGKYVNLLDHHVHTYHLIRGIDIFGLSDIEKDIVACIAYYDHKGIPSEDDEPFRRLPESGKMVALKLVAVFRLARAMDISRRQKMFDISAHVKENTLIITYESQQNTALETWIFEKENELFRNVFGMEAKLERR